MAPDAAPGDAGCIHGHRLLLERQTMKAKQKHPGGKTPDARNKLRANTDCFDDILSCEAPKCKEEK